MVFSYGPGRNTSGNHVASAREDLEMLNFTMSTFLEALKWYVEHAMCPLIRMSPLAYLLTSRLIEGKMVTTPRSKLLFVFKKLFF